MIKGEKALITYLSKVKMTDVTKLKSRRDKDKEVFFKDVG